MAKITERYAFRLIRFSMLEDRAQMDSNCAIPLAQFTTVVGKRSLLHVYEKTAFRSKRNILIGRDAFKSQSMSYSLKW